MVSKLPWWQEQEQQAKVKWEQEMASRRQLALRPHNLRCTAVIPAEHDSSEKHAQLRCTYKSSKTNARTEATEKPASSPAAASAVEQFDELERIAGWVQAMFFDGLLDGGGGGTSLPPPPPPPPPSSSSTPHRGWVWTEIYHIRV